MQINKQWNIEVRLLNQFTTFKRRYKRRLQRCGTEVIIHIIHFSIWIIRTLVSQGPPRLPPVSWGRRGGVWTNLTQLEQCLKLKRYSRAAESESDSVILTGIGVWVAVGKFSSTPTPARRSRSRLQHFFIISLLVKMETEMDRNGTLGPSQALVSRRT